MSDGRIVWSITLLVLGACSSKASRLASPEGGAEPLDAAGGAGGSGQTGGNGGASTGGGSGSPDAEAGAAASGGSAVGSADAGDAGASGAGGAAGGAGSNGLIENFDDVRLGAWFTQDDLSGGTVQVGISAGSQGGNYGRVFGQGFTSWGALGGLAFDPAYAASVYCGLRFSARIGDVPNTTPTVVIKFPIALTADGDHYQRSVSVTTSWASYIVRFAEIQPQGWGSAPPGSFTPGGILAIYFQFPANVQFDLWIDDLEFVTSCDLP